MAEMSLFRLPGDGQAVAGATIIVPLETAAARTADHAVDGGTAQALSVTLSATRLAVMPRSA